MIISEAPWGELVILHYEVVYNSFTHKVPAYILGSIAGTFDSTLLLYLVGFKESPPSDLLPHRSVNHDFFCDNPGYKDVKLFYPSSEIKKEFPYIRWLSGARKCSLVENWPNQKCISCKLDAPHQAPNDGDNFICDFCKELYYISLL